MNKVPKDFFLEFGGHSQSGGFSINHEHIHTLEEVLTKAYEEVETGAAEEKQAIDAPLTLPDISWQLWDEIKELAPFGVGNPKPLFEFQNVLVEKVEHFGKQKNHIKLTLSEGTTRIKAIEFFKTNEIYGLEEGNVITLHGHIEKDVFGYRPELRLRIVEIQS